MADSAVPSGFPDVFRKLAREFPASETKKRKGSGREVFTYITARTAMYRLDEVLGSENWSDEYRSTPHGLICRITYRIPGDESGKSYFKEGIGNGAGMAKADDEAKSAGSDAFKAAAMRLGVGRYLYNDEPDGFWDENPSEEIPQTHPTESEDSPKVWHNPDCSWPRPQSGKALFAALRQLENETGGSFVDPVNKWAEQNQVPRSKRMVDWTGDEPGTLLFDAWVFADSIRVRCQTKLEKPQQKLASPIERTACIKAAKDYFFAVHEHKPDDATLFKLLQETHATLFQGETFNTFKDYANLERIKKMTAYFAKEEKEAQYAATI